MLVEVGGARGAVVYSTSTDGRLEATSSAAPPRTTQRLRHVLAEIFLPAGYPQSVRPEYLRFQAYDTLQAACSYLRSILTTSAILRGVGVGESAASPMAAAAAWVLRDGFGMFGSLLFSYSVGTGFDQNVKEWRLFADLINDVGLTLDMLAPLSTGPSTFATLAALGTACKTICGMVAGATRASISAHLALGDNLADLSAKEGAQEAAVTLVGLVLGSTLAGYVGDSLVNGWIVFVLLTAVHVWSNWRGVGCLAFRWLNLQRGMLVTAAWVERHEIPPPNRLAAHERLWRPLTLCMRGPRLGVSAASVVSSAEDLLILQAIFKEERYMLREVGGRAHVMLRVDATGADALKAILHCTLLRAILQGAAQGAAEGAAKGSTSRVSAAVTRAQRGGAISRAERASLAASLDAVGVEWAPFAAAVEREWDGRALLRGCEGGVRYREGTQHGKDE